MSTPIQPVPPLVLASEFPSLADRPAGTYNAKAKAWADTSVEMAENLRDIAVNAHSNAVAAEERATAADERATDAETAKGLAETARGKAQDWAEGVEPAPGSKSAREWSNRAQEWAEGTEPVPGSKSAKEWASESEAHSATAEAFAAAAGSAAGIPSLEGNEGKVLTVKEVAGVPAAVWAPALQIGDLILSKNDLTGSGFVETGKVYLKNAYPALYEKVGTLPDLKAGESWTALPGAQASGNGPRASWLDNDTVVVSQTTVTSGSQVHLYSVSDGVWTAASNPPISPIDIKCFDGVIYISASNTLNRSLDRGVTWTGVGGAGVNFSHILVRLSESRIAAIQKGSGTEFRLSEDGGATFVAKTLPLSANLTVVVPGRNDSEFFGLNANLADVYRYTIEGDGSIGVVKLPVSVLAGSANNVLARSQDGRIALLSGFAAGTGPGALGVSISDDGGDTWTTRIMPRPNVMLSMGDFSSEGGWYFSAPPGYVFDIDAPEMTRVQEVGAPTESRIYATYFSPDGTKVYALPSSGANHSISHQRFNYDTSTQFYVPFAPAPSGYKYFMKAA